MIIIYEKQILKFYKNYICKILIRWWKLKLNKMKLKFIHVKFNFFISSTVKSGEV